MKKVLLLMSAMVVLIITGCGAVKYNYMPIAAVAGKYPECKNEPSQGDFTNCVNAIVEKEGKAR